MLRDTPAMYLCNKLALAGLTSVIIEDGVDPTCMCT